MCEQIVNEDKKQSYCLVWRNLFEDHLYFSMSVSGTATLGADYDFVGLDGNQGRFDLEMKPGERVKEFLMLIYDDPEIEPEEKINVSIATSNPGYTVKNSTSSIRILDDDATPEVEMSCPSSVTEDDGMLVCVLTRAHALKPLSIDYLYESSATPIDDYGFAEVAGKVLFEKDQTRTTINLSIVDDELIEGEEFLTISLVQNQNFSTVSDLIKTIKIQDNDTIAQVSIDCPIVRAPESLKSVECRLKKKYF